MSIQTRTAAILLSLVLFNAGCAANQAGNHETHTDKVVESPTKVDAPQAEIPDQQEVEQEQGGFVMVFHSEAQADLYGTGTTNKITLHAYGIADGYPELWKLNVDGVQRGALIQPDEGMYGPATKVEATDITDDGNPEVLIYRYNQGTGGGMGLHVYSPILGWEPVFSLENPFGIAADDDHRFNVNYLGDYKMQFEDQVTGLKAQIPLDPTRYKEQEAFLKSITTWVDPISEYSIEAGKITTSARVVGISHPDTLGLLRTTYEWNGLEFVSTSFGLYTEDGKPIKVIKLTK